MTARKQNMCSVCGLFWSSRYAKKQLRLSLAVMVELAMTESKNATVALRGTKTSQRVGFHNISTHNDLSNMFLPSRLQNYVHSQCRSSSHSLHICACTNRGDEMLTTSGQTFSNSGIFFNAVVCLKWPNIHQYTIGPKSSNIIQTMTQNHQMFSIFGSFFATL